jgi:hypothetical protein
MPILASTGKYMSYNSTSHKFIIQINWSIERVMTKQNQKIDKILETIINLYLTKKKQKTQLIEKIKSKKY